MRNDWEYMGSTAINIGVDLHPRASLGERAGAAVEMIVKLMGMKYSNERETKSIKKNIQIHL